MVFASRLQCVVTSTTSPFVSRHMHSQTFELERSSSSWVEFLVSKGGTLEHHYLYSLSSKKPDQQFTPPFIWALHTSRTLNHFQTAHFSRETSTFGEKMGHATSIVDLRKWPEPGGNTHKRRNSPQQDWQADWSDSNQLFSKEGIPFRGAQFVLMWSVWSLFSLVGSQGEYINPILTTYQPHDLIITNHISGLNNMIHQMTTWFTNAWMTSGPSTPCGCSRCAPCGSGCCLEGGAGDGDAASAAAQPPQDLPCAAHGAGKERCDAKYQRILISSIIVSINNIGCTYPLQ